MNIIKIDNDSYGTILVSWVICALLIFFIARFVRNAWVSVPVSAVFVVFMVFITWFFRVPDRNTPSPENHRLVTSVADGKVVIVERCTKRNSCNGNVSRYRCIWISSTSTAISGPLPAK